MNNKIRFVKLKKKFEDKVDKLAYKLTIKVIYKYKLLF